MKATYLHAVGAIALSFSIAACMSAPRVIPAPDADAATLSPDEPAAEPAAPPAPIVALAPAPRRVVQEPTYRNYLDAPQTSGTWEYVNEPGESLGLFGIGNPVHPFVIRCDKTTRGIGLARGTTRDGPLSMRIATETATRTLTATSVPGYGMVAATLDANDPLLDAMAITKGRFAVSVEGERTLYIPAWVEISRVIEDCR